MNPIIEPHKNHLIIQRAQKIVARNPRAAAKAEELIVKDERKIADHGIFIRRAGTDAPEIAEWRWNDGQYGF